MKRMWTGAAIGAAVIAMSLAGCSGNNESPTADDAGKITSSAPTVIDPVCGMKLTKDQIVATHEYGGKTYSFCMMSDRDAFAAEPEKYLKGGAGHDSTGCPYHDDMGGHHDGADSTGCPHHGGDMGGHHGGDGGEDDGHGGHHGGDDGGMGGMHGGH